MCGIAGIVDSEPGAVVEAGLVRRMCQTILHRGPDDEGIYAEGGVGLGIRRLSILDLAGGHQPVHNEDETVWIVFNGEIYNFPELRAELEARGHHFYTRTDTEVIVHLYEDRGAPCVESLRGMFAFALYDERRHRLLLARDRVGVKPLHYALVKGRLLFASEIKAILAAAPELKEIRRESLLEYFSLRYIPDPHTAFQAIEKLPPGHTLEFTGGRATIRQYWDFPAYGTSAPRSEQECLAELEERLAEAVRIRLVADVPLGALLSGGTDSSTVVALMARSSSRPVKTFSIAFGEDEFNEARYARRVAERFSTEHHELVVQPNFGATLEALTGSLEEPFGDSSMLPTYHVCRMARQHVTVALAGDGGDELFAGYERYRVHQSRRRWGALRGPFGRWYRNRLYAALPEGFYGRNWLFNVSLGERDRYLDSISVLPPLDRQRSLFSGDFLASANGSAHPLAVLRHQYDHAPTSDPLGRLLYLDSKTSLPGDMLTKVDRMSMATALEVRLPLLDHVLAETVTALPTPWKSQNGQGKYLLRKLAERVGVPREVLDRPKQGFAMPLVHWMRKELRDEFGRLLLEPRTTQRGYFRPEALRRLLDEHFRGRRDHAQKIWLLVIFELWHRNFLEAPWPPARLPLPVSVAAGQDRVPR